MGRPCNTDGRHTRQAILDASLSLFAEHGFNGTSLRDIARAVGVRESAFYNYFPGKDAIFTGILDAAKEHRTQQLEGFLLEAHTRDPQELLEAITATILDTFADPRQQQLFRVMMSDGMRLAREGRISLIERMTSGAAPLHKLMATLVSRGHLRRLPPGMLAIEFMGPLLMWRHWHALDPKGPLIAKRSTFIRGHVEQFLHGAGANRAHPAGRARSTASRGQRLRTQHSHSRTVHHTSRTR
jgi:AcrR family transcriptional regulator